MRRTLVSPFVLLLALAAPAAAQSKAVNPVGAFEYSTTVDGNAVSGVITISKKDDALTGTITSDMMEPIPITSVKIEDRKVTLVGTIPDGQLTIVLNFEDDDKFSGNWSLGDQGGAISGKRKTS